MCLHCAIAWLGMTFLTSDTRVRYRVIPFHFKIDAFRQAGEAGEAGEAGGERKIICMADFVKWY
ncbi:hypothetical protein NIES4103_30370 [Nostoc sp. NIES-4103]|nr:hypothetical protein NIES4103_30370 [Nostoc sp. NIES-4103]